MSDLDESAGASGQSLCRHKTSFSPDLPDIPAALLAGGLATRLRPITTTIPKALVDIDGRPFIEHQLLLLRSRGIRRAVFCLGHLGEQVEAHLGDGRRWGMEFRYSYDGDRLLGTGGALRRALPLLDEVFWVLYADSYTEIDFRAVYDRFQSTGALGVMTVLNNGDRWDRSNVVFRDGQLLYYSKKNRTPEMSYIDCGVVILRRSALERIPQTDACDLADLYGELIQERSMVGHEVSERFYEIGTPESLEETRRYLRAKESTV